MKKTIVFLLVSLCAVYGSYAQGEGAKSRLTVNGQGDYCFETSFTELVSQGINSEIQVFNNSAFTVSNLLCTVFINGKSHSLKAIHTLLPTEDDEFDGYDDDEMKDEFPHFFGSDGAFKKRNTNKIQFVISFRPQQKNVEITNIYFRKKSIVFVIDNSEEGKKNLESGNMSEKVVIDGKTYILYGGKFVPLDD
jgi:hypothetical protein